jgi:hypothetical protein
MRVEAPCGFEPQHKGFADLSLSHLGTAPLHQLDRYCKRQRIIPQVLDLLIHGHGKVER